MNWMLSIFPGPRPRWRRPRMTLHWHSKSTPLIGRAWRGSAEAVRLQGGAQRLGDRPRPAARHERDADMGFDQRVGLARHSLPQGHGGALHLFGLGGDNEDII